MKKSTLIFLIQGDSVLLALKKDGFGAGFLNGYGGKEKPIDKTIEDIATRELFEESRVRAKSLEKVSIVDFFKGQTQIFECHVYFCSRWEGEISETKEMGFPNSYKMTEIPFDKMWHADRTWLPIIFSGKKIKAQVYYDENMILERFEYVLL